MILGDGWQMLMVTEEQDHKYFQNGKKYRKCQKTDPQNLPIVILFTLSHMVYLNNLAIWQGIQYSKFFRKIVTIFKTMPLAPFSIA